jgi:hypothetical protein
VPRPSPSRLAQTLTGRLPYPPQVIPHVFDNLLLSAQAMAAYIAEAMTEGQQFSDVEQMLHLALPESSHLVRGLKIQVGSCGCCGG